MMLNPKIFIGVAIVALAVILGGILLTGPSLTLDPVGDSQQQQQQQQQIQTLRIELDDINVSKISERTATIDVIFVIHNPNPRAVIVQTMDYQLFETSYSESEQLSGGQIGSRPEGMVEFGSNYYTLLGENSITLKDTITLRNSGNTPQLWTDLRDGTASWRVTGTVFFNLSSMTSGQENEINFEFVS